MYTFTKNLYSIYVHEYVYIYILYAYIFILIQRVYIGICLVCRQALTMNDKDVSASSPSLVLSPSSIKQKKIAGSSSRDLSLGRGLPEGLAVEAFASFFLLMESAIFGVFFTFQHKSISNQKSVSNITMPYLRQLWLQSTSSNVLDKLLDQAKVDKLCCCDIVSDQVKRVEVESSDLSKDIQVTGGKVSSQLTEFCCLWLSGASHITLYNKLCHSSNIRDPTELPVYVCVCVLF